MHHHKNIKQLIYKIKNLLKQIKYLVIGLVGITNLVFRSAVPGTKILI